MNDLAVIIPIRNEESNLACLIDRLTCTLDALGLRYNIVFVTDENIDDTLNTLRKCSKDNPMVLGIKLSRNSGQHLAIMVGLAHVDSKHYVIMDGDLQDYPEDIPLLYEKALEGFDVVYGIKEKKNDSGIRNFFSKSFNRVMKILSDVKMESNTSMFRVISRKMANEILRYKEREPSLNLIMPLINLPTVGVNVQSGERYAGKTNYSFRRMLSLSLNFILSFSTKPLRFMSWFGVIVSLLSFGFVLISLIQSFIIGTAPLGWATIVAGIFAIGGLQIFFVGIIGEYIGRIYLQSKNRPLYTIEETIGNQDMED